MSGIGLMEIIPFFVATAICLGLVIMWMLSSESKRNICKAEIVKLKTQVDALEKEKMALIDNASGAQSANKGRDPADEARIAEDEEMILVLKEKTEALEKENKSLKAELAEAKSSLEEVYKALVEQAPQAPKKRGRSS
jgi:predicted RNase H-like nuclease (RuvC/YqgF family)